MPPLDWGRIMGTNVAELREDLDAADEMYGVLEMGSVNPDSAEAEDVNKMIKLFEVTKTVMKVKSLQVELATEEIKAGGGDREQELLDEISHLEREIQQYRDPVPLQDPIGSYRILQDPTGSYRILQDPIGSYRILDRIVTRMAARLDEAEKENKSLKRDLERNKMDLRDIQRQFEQQRESMVVRKGEGSDFKEKISKKNKELSEYLDEIRILQEANDELEERIKNTEKELQDATAEMDKMTDEYTKLRTILQQSDMIIDDMRKERDALRAQVQDLRMQFSTKTDTDEQIMAAVNSKVEEWKAVLAAKEIELEQYRSLVQELKRQAAGLQMDTDKTSLAMLQQAVAEKDEQIENLKKELEKVNNLEIKVNDSEMENEELRERLGMDPKEKLDIEVVRHKKKVKAEQAVALNRALTKEVERLEEERLQLKRQLRKQALHRGQSATSVITKCDKCYYKVRQASSDMHGVASYVEEVKALTEKGVPSAYQQKRIRQLNSTLQKEQLEVLQFRDRMIMAEKAAAMKDKQLNDLLAQMMQYERGEYGLSEAVQEIKDCKAQIRIRDQNIEDLTSQVNNLEIKVNDSEMENEELRERLGMDPKEKLDIEVVRHKKKVKAEQAVALNRALTKEVERLEEERLQLKRQLRKQALHRGQRAVELGITAEDLIVAEEEDVVSSPRRLPVVDSDGEVTKALNQRLEGEVEKNEKQIEKYKSDMKKIETENKELKDENKQLEVGMREILAQLREHAAAQGVEENKLVQVPALEKLMAMIESRNAVGQYDTTLQLKAQIEQLSGRNEELRHELHNARAETAKAIMQLERKNTKIEDLEKDIKVLKEIGEGAVKLQPMPLPQGMTPSSTEIIASLNEHLIQVLQEVSLKEQLLEKMEKDLEMFKRKFSVILHQKGLLYVDFMKEKETWEKEKKAIEEDKASTELAREHDKIRLMEFERLLDTLEKDEDKQKKRLGEMTRKVTVLRVNEKSLSRRYTAMQDVEAALRKENKRYKNDVVAMETAVTEKLGYLQRHKEMSTYKIGVLQQALDESVLATELEAANKQYNELTAKYRDVIQRENSLVARSAIVDNLEADLKALEEREAELKKEMISLKERNHSLEQMVNELLSKGGGEGEGDTSIVRQEEIDRISRKLATLEMKELNERERADHATRKYEQVQSLIKQLEERNVELEQKFAEISKLNLESQRVERQLRDEISNSVTQDTHVAVTRRVRSLEESESKLKVEVSRLKEVAEVASHQTEAIKAQQESHDRELTSLRKQLYDMQMETDDKTIIGKLHHHIVALQVSEGTAVRKLEAAMQKLSRQEAHVLRLERQIDEKGQALYHAKMEARNKAKFLKRTIQDLRRQYSGALPLMKQEKFAETMRSLHEDKHKLEGELKKARTDREAAEDKLAELQLQHDGLQELMATLKDGKGAAKVTEWHAKMGEIRLQDLKLNRAITRLQEELKHLENMTKVQERTISDLEDENVQLSKEHEERQLLWEQREVELERTIDKVEKQQEQLADAAAKFEEATGSIPDPDLPVANQLEMAIRNIKEHIRIIVGTREESKALKKKYEELDQAFKQSEERLTQKDKLINELRLRLPLSERGEITAEAKKAAGLVEEDYESKRALKVAQATVSSLQQMLARKEESLAKYQEMLKEAREEAKTQTEQHKAEIQLLQDRLHLETDETFRRKKTFHMDSVNDDGPPVPSHKQLARLSELEEMVTEQDNALAVAAEKYKKSRNEISKMKKDHEEQVNSLKQQMARKNEEHSKEVTKLNSEKLERDDRIMEQGKEIEVLKDELESAKEAAQRAPSKTMKHLVERLKNQLALKEKQQKSLSQALLQLRADMVTTAEENVQVHAKKAEQQVNVQHIVEKETAGLQARLEELQDRMEKLKKELRKQKDKESTLLEERDKLKQDFAKKDSALLKLGRELKELETVQEQLEKKEEELRTERNTLAQERAESEKLRERVKSLQGKIKQIKQKSSEDSEGGAGDDKPIVEEVIKEDRVAVVSEGVARWEDNKKWQQKVETLKGKLAEKTRELEKAEKTIGMLRDAVSRAEKDKAGLHSRLKSSAKSSTGGQALVTNEVVQDLRQNIFKLEEENQELRRHKVLGHDKQMEALELRNKQLVEYSEGLERDLAGRMAEQRTVDHADADMYREMYQRIQSLQKQLLETKEENMELRFDYEQARKENPRLKARVEDLQEYVEILKAELEASKKREKARKKSLGTGMGGQSVEDLERVIAAMRRVVERLQGENDQLKKTVGAGGPQYGEVMKENKRLKHELEKAKVNEKTQSSRGGSSQGNTAKLMAENDKLLKDLKKEMEEVEKLKTTNANLEQRKEELVKELEQLHQRLSTTNMQGLDSKEWKSVVLPKIYEEKMQKLEAELEKKTNLLKDIKTYLKAAANRETELMKKQQELEEKNNDYKQKPNSSTIVGEEFERNLGRGGGENLNVPIFKSSNAQGFPQEDVEASN
ncbi:Centrosomal protein of 290 kDa [Stylophora pistillata]|uniref:Centrosomal protein of 290 kDa n=1 Tax=Stylophora pistillata TaxID=50429 RepID=A0A2B4RNB3_STYPI|nr:Centrosomal protein of 290 kDa [Stylophora pistillata]